MYEPQISTAEQIARGIAAAKGGPIRRSGKGYGCRCPAHADKDPSLSVSDGQHGPLVHCHAGCSQESVIEALRDLGLWHTRPRAKVEPMRPRGIPGNWHGKPFLRLYTYATQTGEIVGYVARYEDANGKETIPFFQSEGDRWKAGAPAEPSPLYGLGSLSKGGPVYVVEGEKSADALIRRGYACVTSQGGSNAAKKADWSPLAGRDVIIWPDHDEPGKKYAATVRSCLRGIASSVRLVDVPRMNPDKPGWDAADWDGLGQIAIVDETPKTGAAPDFRVNNNGGMKAVTYNLVLLLGTPALCDTLGWDMLADKPVWRSKPPFLQEHRAEIHDQDAAEFAFWAAEQISADFKSSQALEAIEVTAKRHPFHPVQDYLRRLRWDGTPRLDSWLEDVFGVPSTPYHQAVGAKFLIAAVARAMRPGCQMDTMMVLMGKQGVGKTSAVRELLPDFAWYAETTESPANKDFYQSLRGKWIVEIGELHSFRNADWTKIKQMLSAKVDTYRASYAHFAKDYPRQCVFIGTTNDDTWNRDATGARRFWPVNVLDVNLDYVRHQRDQLWAEAFLRYTQGEDWWTVPVEEAADVQDSVYETDPWQEPIRKWLAKCGLPYVTSTTVMIDGLQIEVSKVDLKGQRRVADCLKRLGYERIKKRVDGVPQWVFVRSP